MFRSSRKEVVKASREYRKEKYYRTHGGAKDDVELVNILRPVGVDLFSVSRKTLFKDIPGWLEGRRLDSVPSKTLEFLRENYGVTTTQDQEGRILIHFPIPKEEKMKLAREIAESIEEKPKTVRKVLDGLKEYIQDTLKKERRVRIPGFFRISIKFRPARPKRKGTNPFTGKPAMFEAKPASNKLKISPSKEFKDFVKELPVKPPEKMKKKSKK